MSYYCGFQNRQQLQQYEQLTQLLLVTLNKRLVKFYQNDECDEMAFRNIFHRIVSGMKTLESQKYMPPRFSETVKTLVEILQIEEQQENDNFFQSNGFDMIQKQANFVLASNSKQQQSKTREDTQEMPPYPQIKKEKTEYINKFEALYGRIGKPDQYSNIDLKGKDKKSENRIAPPLTATPHRVVEHGLQENMSKEVISQIEQTVTRNVLDRLVGSRRCKKKKQQKTQSNSFQFRQILLTTNEKQNQSFQSTRRKFNAQ